MPDLNFDIIGIEARPERPVLLFQLRITEAEAVPVHSIRLRCQIRLQPGRRRYSGEEQTRLLDLFGTPDRWSQTLRDFPWTSLSIEVPGFVGETVVDLPAPAAPETSAASRYFEALEIGDIALSFLFSGMAFYEEPGIGLQIAPIPWDREAGYRLPVAIGKHLVQEPASS